MVTIPCILYEKNFLGYSTENIEQSSSYRLRSAIQSFIWREVIMKMRYLSGLALASALVLSACAGGGAGGGSTSPGSSSGGAAADGANSLLIYVDPVREPACNQFKESRPDVDVTCEVVGQEEVLPKVALANQTKSGWPDVTFNPSNNVGIFQDPLNGYALKLDDYVDPAIIESYGGSGDWCKIDGSYYCLKNDLAQTVLWYDAVTFEELGLTVPTTMNDFAATALKLKGTGFVAGAIGDQGFYAGYLWPSGCPVSQVIDTDTVRINPDAAECKKVYALVQPLIDAGVLDTRGSFDAGFIEDVARKGKVAMQIGPSWWGQFVIRPADSWGIAEGRMTAAEMPIWAGESVNYSGEWGGGVWVGNSNHPNPQLVADAIVYFATDPDMRADKVTFPGSKPAFEKWRAPLTTDPFYAADPTAAMVAQVPKIRQTERPARFDLRGQIGVLATEIQGTSDIEAAVRTFMLGAQELAKGVGYTVID
jgi:ABC-type glycerol-3-phosphate transport system substrate-binding protein